MLAKYAPFVAAPIIVLLLAARFSHTLYEPLSYNDTRESVRMVRKVLPHQHSLPDLWRWTHSRWPMQPSSHYYRPLAMFSFVADWHLWKENAFGYRLTSLLLLIACALAFGAMAGRIVGPAGWLAAVMWAWAPIRLDPLYLVSPALHLAGVQDKATTWVIARPDLLATVFVLLGCWSVTKQGRALWLFPLFHFAALLSKESAIPLAGLITVYALLEEKNWAQKRGYVLMAWAVLGVYLILRQIALHVDPVTQLAGLPRRAPTMARWLGMFLLGPGIRFMDTAKAILISGWMLLEPSTWERLVEAALYFFSLYLLLRFQVRQLVFWIMWAFLFVVLIIHLPVFWAWGHYWLLASFAAPALLCVALKALWQEMIAPRPFGRWLSSVLGLERASPAGVQEAEPTRS